MSQKKALIAMSGGVDSSVAAWLTMQQGYTCAGATMRLYDAAAYGAPAAPDGIADAAAVAQRLGIGFHVLDFTSDFDTQVIGDFVHCYESGLTPNPCIRCNRLLKFGVFVQSQP